MKLLFVSILWVLGCGAGNGDGDGDCATQDDCDGETYCVGPNEWRGCGIPAMEGCQESADCGSGLVCAAVFDSCSPDGVGSQCDTPCDEPYGGCATGMECVDSACVPTACASNEDCAEHMVCEAVPDGPMHARTDGCVTVSCTSDGDCAPGACVNGVCQDAPGSCEEPEMLP